MKTSFAIVVIALLATAMQAHAGPEGAGSDRREMMKQKIQEQLKQVDTNNDGIISKAEFLIKAEEKFSKMDVNSDGNITVDERSAMREQFNHMSKDEGVSEKQFP